jgi:hypothetical protein
MPEQRPDQVPSQCVARAEESEPYDSELANTVSDAGDLQRYPTTREIVDAALAPGVTPAARPTRSCPNYVVPCEDLDGTAHQLVVVALGGRVALVGPGGTTTVLPAHAVGALGDSLHDTLVAKVHGGDVCTGELEVAAKHEVFLTEKADVSVTARPYTKTVELGFEFFSARFTCWLTLDEIRALTRMLTDAETTMLGWHKKPAEPTGTDSLPHDHAGHHQ